jgi:hypothetical protein
MRAAAIVFVLSAVLAQTSVCCKQAFAYDAYDPANCNGAGDDKRSLTVSKVTAHPRINFVKSPYDDDFTASTCPASTKACQKKDYLLTGDLVLVGEARGDFSCVSYQSPLAKKQVWANGWLPTTALAPVAPMPSPKTADWLGTWRHPGGHIDVKSGAAGKLNIEGEMVVPTARDFHNGGFKAQVTPQVAPQTATLAFTDDGSSYGQDCKVRMERIGAWLLVVDNAGCGGAGVSFLGLYRRGK